MFEVMHNEGQLKMHNSLLFFILNNAIICKSKLYYTMEMSPSNSVLRQMLSLSTLVGATLWSLKSDQLTPFTEMQTFQLDTTRHIAACKEVQPKKLQ